VKFTMLHIGERDSVIPGLPRLVDQETALQYLQVSRHTLWSLRRSGVLRAVRVGRQLRFRVDDLERFIEGDD
jgi:excisionase family DNA binding protein